MNACIESVQEVLHHIAIPVDAASGRCSVDATCTRPALNGSQFCARLRRGSERSIVREILSTSTKRFVLESRRYENGLLVRWTSGKIGDAAQQTATPQARSTPARRPPTRAIFCSSEEMHEPNARTERPPAD